MCFLECAFIFLLGAFVATFGTLAGGGSIVTIPTLIFLGLSPTTAIATNRLGIMGAHITGLYEFGKKGFVDVRFGMLLAITCVAGAAMGANFVLGLEEEMLKRVVGFLTIALLILLLKIPRKGLVEGKSGGAGKLLGIFFGFFIGIYAGLYGAGTGTILSYLLILGFGQTFLQAAGTRKIPLLALSFAATLVFAIHELIVYPIGVALFLGTAIGSYIGAHYSDRVGNEWVRRVFVIVALVMGAKLLMR